MKPQLSLLAFTALFGASLGFAQGPLAPPAAPGPTMKSLDQIEARTPISAAPFSINVPGSYYLTQNISVNTADAIIINTDNVTLDLNGFRIASFASPAAGTAILLNPGTNNITIRNGHIKGQVTFSGSSYSGTGFKDGIAATTSRGVLVTDVTVSGVLDDGIYLGEEEDSTVVRACSVQIAGGVGIRAAVVDSSVARQAGSTGVKAETASNSVGESTSFSWGLQASTAINCKGIGANGPGLGSYVATNCVGITAGGQVALSAGGTASFCRGTNNGGGLALNATIAIGCTSGGGGISATGGKFLGTP